MKKIKNSVIGLAALAIACLFTGTVQAGVPEGNMKVYDVTAYGADVTGKKDSSSEVQAALLAAKTDLRKGNMDGKEKAVIYFPKGTYKIKSALRLYQDMGITAEKSAKIIASGSSDVILTYNTEDCVIEGGTWDASGEGVIVHATGAKNLLVRNMTLQNAKTGATVYQSTGTINGVTVSKCKNQGFTISNASKITVKNCKVTKNGSSYPNPGFLGHGIGVYNGAKLTLKASEISFNKTGGVSLQDADMTADGTLIRDNGYNGVGTSRVCNLTMKNCDIYHNGYKVKGNDNGVSVVANSIGRFTNCKFRSNEVTGLLATGNAKISVKGCTFKGNGYHNIYMENNGTGKVSGGIDSCTFYKSGHDSVAVHVKKKVPTA